jgi:outer membrane protein TolC
MKKLGSYLLLCLLPVYATALSKISLQEAIEETIANQWDILISEMKVEEQQGAVIQTHAPFDPLLNFVASDRWFNDNTLQNGLNIPPNVSATLPLTGKLTSSYPGGFPLHGYNALFSASLSKKSRLGTQFSIETSTNKTKNTFFDFYNPYPQLSPWSIPFIRQGNANISFTINQPLLKGFIYGQETVDEKNKEFLLQAYQNELINNVATQTLSSIEAYWDVVRAQLILEERKKSEADNQRYFDNIFALIEGNQFAKTELQQAIRALADAKSDITIAKQDITLNTETLIFRTGKKEKYSRICQDNVQLDPLPQLDEASKKFCEYDVMAAINFAWHHRKDLKALEYQEKAADIKTKGAFNEILPALNMEFQTKNLNTVYQRPAKTLFEPMNMRVPRTEFALKFSLNFPIFSSLGRGKLISTRAEKHKISYQIEQLKAKIFSEVVSAVNNHQSLMLEMIDVEEATKTAQQYVNDQETLIKQGLTSVFQLLDSHAKLVAMEIKKIEIMTNYAKNLAKLRYLLGALIEQKEEKTNQFSIYELNTLPNVIKDNL